MIQENDLNACGKRGGGSCAPINSDDEKQAHQESFDIDGFALQAVIEYFSGAYRVLH